MKKQLNKVILLATTLLVVGETTCSQQLPKSNDCEGHLITYLATEKVNAERNLQHLQHLQHLQQLPDARLEQFWASQLILSVHRSILNSGFSNEINFKAKELESADENESTKKVANFTGLPFAVANIIGWYAPFYHKIICKSRCAKPD